MHKSEYRLRRALGDALAGTSRFRALIFLDEKSSEDAKTMFSAPTTEVLSERNVRFIQKCIAESTESIETVAFDLPTRLLDLADFHLGRAKLILSEGIPGQEKVKYATLSDCWGNGDIAKSQSITTLGNQEERKNGFEISDLSPVIQDAIKAKPRILPSVLSKETFRLTSC